MNKPVKLTPFGKWRKQHPLESIDDATNIKIDQWFNVSDVADNLIDDSYETVDPWLERKTTDEPNFVKFFAGWGYIRAITGDWKSVPIDIPPSELDEWKSNGGLPATIDDIRGDEAQLVWIIADALNRRFDDTIALIKNQLDALLSELAELSSKPLDSFTPTQWDADSSEVYWADDERKELDRIFSLYETIWCFEQGLEGLRMLVVTEVDPEIGVPSQKFFDGLMTINSHKVMVTLKDAEPKMKEILKLWSQTIMAYSNKPYYVQRDWEPEAFWWRHWKPSKARSNK